MKIGVIGASGRMGMELVKAVLASSDCALSGATVKEGNDLVGKDAAILANKTVCNVAITTDNKALVAVSDAVIDFTSPATSVAIAQMAADAQTIHVCGTTGLSDNDFDVLELAAQKTSIIWSSNMSIGVNLVNMLVEQAAGLLDSSYDIEVLEMHHRHKKDSPSGTAITLGQSAAKGRNLVFDEVATLSREGIVGERPEDEIGFATLRGGSVIGDHSVIFAGDSDRIEITHKSSNRGIYASGAVKACLWASHKGPGFYSMRDVLS